MAFLTRDGVRLYYEDHGSGPAVLLTHGYSATSQMWRGQIAAFEDRYRLIIWDMRGHGESDYPDDPALYSTAHTVADMAAVLDVIVRRPEASTVAVAPPLKPSAPSRRVRSVCSVSLAPIVCVNEKAFPS